MADIGYSTLSVIPSMKNFGSLLTKGIEPEMALAGAAGGKSLSSALKKFAPIAATAAIVGTLAAIGKTFHEMESTIRVGTGTTGKAFDDLVTSAKNVGKTVPSSFSDIGKTVSALHVRLGLTGPVLETMSKQFLLAGRITKQSLDLGTVTGSFNAFGLKSKDMSKALDDLFRISQATGVGINELAGAATKGAPAFRQFGMSFSTSAALVGVLDKAGINSGKTIMALTIGLTKFAKAGKEPAAALRATIDQIKAFTTSGNDAKAIALAASIFGTRGAAQFVAAVKSGKVNLDDMMKSAGAGKDTILASAAAVSTFSSKWALFKNNVLLLVEPIAARVFKAFGDGMQFMVDVGLPALTKFGAGVSALFAVFKTDGISGVFSSIGEKISAALPGIEAALAKWGVAFWAWIQTAALPMLAELAKLYLAIEQWIWGTALPAIVTALARWGAAFVDWIGPQIPPLLAKLAELASQLGAWLTGTALPAISAKLSEWGNAFVTWIGPKILPMLAALAGLLAGLGDWLIGTALPWIVTKLDQWGSAFLNWIRPKIPGMLLKLVELIVAFDVWAVTVALPRIMEKLGEWGQALIEWIGPRIPGVLEEFGKLMARIVTWVVTEGIPKLETKLGELAQKGIAALVKMLGEKVADITDWFSKLPAKIVSAIGNLGSTLFQAGKDVIAGFVGGTAYIFKKVISFCASVPGKIVDAIGDLLGTLFTAGKNVMTGLKNGIVEGAKSVYQALTDITNMIPLKKGPPAKDLLLLHESGQLVIRGFVNGLQSKFAEVESVLGDFTARLEIAFKAKDLSAGLVAMIKQGDAALEAAAATRDALADRFKAATDRLTTLIDARASFIASATQATTSGGNLTGLGATGVDATVDAATILDMLKAKVDQATTFASNLIGLGKAGLSKQMLEQLAAAGAEQASASAAALNAAGADAIKQANALQLQLQDAARIAAKFVGNDLYNAGIAAAQGLLKGLKSQQAAIEAQMLEIAKSMAASIRKALGIKSPSTLFAQVGRYVGEGLIAGMDAMQGKATASAGALIGSVSAPRIADPATAIAQGVGGPTGNVIRIGQVTLPNVRNGADFIREIQDYSRANGWSWATGLASA
jgi:TP901 family phage tail tape measure protein